VAKVSVGSALVLRLRLGDVEGPGAILLVANATFDNSFAAFMNQLSQVALATVTVGFPELLDGNPSHHILSRSLLILRHCSPSGRRCERDFQWTLYSLVLNGTWTSGTMSGAVARKAIRQFIIS